jgi:hypothetical protein
MSNKIIDEEVNENIYLYRSLYSSQGLAMAVQSFFESQKIPNFSFLNENFLAIMYFIRVVYGN